MKTVKDLVTILTLKEGKNNQYIGISKPIGSPHVFGGQVLAQSVNAAYRTAPKNRFLHSLHAYFLEAGDLKKPITYSVETIRDGGSFSTRRVTAKQEDVIIFILAASFHQVEKGYEHQISMTKNLTPPEKLLSWEEMAMKFGDFLPKKLKNFLAIDRPIIFKPIEKINPLHPKDLAPTVAVWFKLKGDVQNLSIPIKQQILTYISDYNILNAALNPHASSANYSNTQMASLDHAMWFFRDFDFDDWMLYSIESPNTFGARGFACGHIFTRKGKLIATVAQEGLMRPLKTKN